MVGTCQTYAKIAALLYIALNAWYSVGILIRTASPRILQHSAILQPYIYLIGISKPLRSKIKHANHYGLRTLMNLGNNVSYNVHVRVCSVQSLEHRRLEQSFKSYF